MDKYIDKVTMLILCAVFYVQYQMNYYFVVPLICVIIISAFMSYTDSRKVKFLAALFFFGLAAFYPVFLFFLPLICYDVFGSKYQAGLALAIIPVSIGFQTIPLTSTLFIILITGLAWLIKWRSTSLETTRHDYICLRDSTKELSLLLENKNKELMEKQDYEIHLATLNERNRIARDIHDSVGHILSNSILQAGAIMATCSDAEVTEKIKVLKNTLVTGMDSVRTSVHDLYEESIDLHSEVKRLCDGFDFCSMSLGFDIESNPEKTVKYTILSVIREALSNIIHHSDATQVNVTLIEHPAIYQLIIKDNGTQHVQNSDGIGLKNIAQRVGSVGGLVNISHENGFLVFVSIPKQQKRILL